MLLKHIFRGCQIIQKTPPFLYNNPQMDLRKIQDGGLKKLLKKAQRDILKARPIE
jgi:hypothetical protein